MRGCAWRIAKFAEEGEEQGSNSLLIPCYSLFRFWAKFSKAFEFGGIPPKIERI
jgi:hypothetical protein